MNNKIKKLDDQDIFKISGGGVKKSVYNGSTPNFSHPIKSEILSKHFVGKPEDKDLSINSEITDTAK